MEALDRARSLAAMASETYDVVVVGGGMTGAGVALDAASRGFHVALVESHDLGSGTTAKSSKMVHGGLRYLQQHEFRLVYENLRERQRLLENAPHLVRPLPFVIPMDGARRPADHAVRQGYAAALWLYDLTGGWRIGERHHRLTSTQLRELLPAVAPAHLTGGFTYLDARGDDSRVALAAARTAALDFGADVANYVTACGFEHGRDGRVRAVTARDELGGRDISIATRSVVNATGVWSDGVRRLADRNAPPVIVPAKGVHLVVPRHRLEASSAAVLGARGGRIIFVIPFEDAPYVYFGTTDTPYQGSLDDPQCTPEDVAYLLDTVNQWTASALTPADVTGLWAGLRPLLAPSGRRASVRTTDLSRRHRVVDDGSGMVHVTGGKWTTYRQMGQDAVDALAPYLGERPCRTARLPLRGAGPFEPSTPLEARLRRRYGSETPAVTELIARDPSLADIAIPGQDYCRAEVVYAVRAEMAMTLEDVLERRTRAHLHDARATARAAHLVARLVGDELGWDGARRDQAVEDYRRRARHEFAAAGIPWEP